MSRVEHTRSLIAYNEWANRKVLDAAAALSEDEFGRQVSGSHRSVRMTLLHIARVQTWWLSVWAAFVEWSSPEADRRSWRW